jgi:hypothetical protein
VSLGEIDLNHYSSLAGPVIPKCAPTQLLDPTQECSTGAITAWTNQGRSIYEGLLVKLNKRFSNRYQFTASYALQNGNTVETIYNLNNYFQSYGPYLPRHNFNLSGTINLPWKFELGFNSSMVSRTPVQPVIAGVDLAGTGITTSPLPGTSYHCFNLGCGKSDLANALADYNAKYGKNLAVPANYDFGDNSFSQDIRLTRRFIYRERYNLAIFGEVFNTLNIANLTGYSSTIGTAFGQPTQRAAQSFLSGGPRAIQVGGRFSF